jgi:hypothetical protein
MNDYSLKSVNEENLPLSLVNHYKSVNYKVYHGKFVVP